MTVNNGGVYNETGVAAINFGGSLTDNGTTFTANTGTHTFSGTSQTIAGTSAISIPTAIFTGAYTNNGTLTDGTALTVTGTTLTNDGTLTARIFSGGTDGLSRVPRPAS